MCIQMHDIFKSYIHIFTNIMFVKKKKSLVLNFYKTNFNTTPYMLLLLYSIRSVNVHDHKQPCIYELRIRVLFRYCKRKHHKYVFYSRGISW